MTVQFAGDSSFHFVTFGMTGVSGLWKGGGSTTSSPIMQGVILNAAERREGSPKLMGNIADKHLFFR